MLSFDVSRPLGLFRDLLELDLHDSIRIPLLLCWPCFSWSPLSLWPCTESFWQQNLTWTLQSARYQVPQGFCHEIACGLSGSAIQSWGHRGRLYIYGLVRMLRVVGLLPSEEREKGADRLSAPALRRRWGFNGLNHFLSALAVHAEVDQHFI